MAEQLVHECPVFLPTLERAGRIVPPEFLPCYAWFLDSMGETIPRLPHRLPDAQKPDTPIPLSRDAGIYIPSSTHVEYDGGRRYALSVHSAGAGKYDDRAPIPLADGTWVLDYAAHEGKDSRQGYNSSLLNCLNDGVPVGVMVRVPSGYQILGLAYVERYNSAMRVFTLHGPITPSTEAAGAFVPQGFEELSQDERDLFVDYDGTDERRVATVRQVRREQQGRFRDELLKAYAGRCAISGTNVPEVLQAAHINPYRGRRSQIVSNGILLRADLHLLYDAHLISVEPDSLEVAMGERLSNTTYLQYNARKLYRPTKEALAPNRDLLAVHYEQFRRENHVLVA